METREATVRARNNVIIENNNNKDYQNQYLGQSVFLVAFAFFLFLIFCLSFTHFAS